MATKPSSPKALTEEDLSDIFQELIAIQAKWYNFGLMLNVPDHVLQSIEYRYPSSMDCLREVIKYFLTNHPNPSWETIVEALRSRTVGHANLAKQLEDKKCCEEVRQPGVRELQQQFEQMAIKLEEEVKKGSERDEIIKKLDASSQQQEKSLREMKFAMDQRQRDMDERFKKEESKGRERDGRLEELEHVQSKQKSVELETETKQEHVGQQSKLITSMARLGARSVAKEELPPQPYKILLIGETGSGKTSFLNFICNAEIIQRAGDIMMAVDKFRPLNDVKLENARAKLIESKTTGAKVYRTKIMNLDVDIIDTPGFGDSHGMERDKENVESIISTVSGEEYLNCICLIINGRQSRISATLKYVLSEITAILPRQAVNNIIVVFTNVSEQWALHFDVNVLYEYFGQFPKEHVFCLENPYCRFEKAKEKQGVLTEKWINDSLRRSLEDGNAMLKNLHKVISILQPVHTCYFDQLFDRKEAIERNVIKLFTEYDNQKKLESEIRKAGKEVEAAAQIKHLNMSFKFARTVERWVQEETDQRNTICGGKDCYSNCHVICSVPRRNSKSMIWFCESIQKNGECKKCGHSYKLHYHNKLIHKEEEKYIEIIDREKQRKFFAAANNKTRNTILLAGIKEKLSLIALKRKMLFKELSETILQFQELGLNRNYITLLENQIELLNQRMKGETGGCAKDLMFLKQQLEETKKLVQEAMTQ